MNGKYQVSNLGRVKSLARNVKYQNSERKIKEKIREGFISARGYKRIELSKNGINKKYNIHRLVAQTFIPNVLNKAEVNHINGIKTDNRVENLEWCTSKENQIHAIKNGLQKPSEKQKSFISKYSKENKIKPIVQLDLNKKFIKEWKSAKEVQDVLGINRKNISQCITGRSKTANGFIWITKEQYNANCFKLEE